MFVLKRPLAALIQNYLVAQQNKAFSYRDVGSSADTPPVGYIVDHNRVRLGYGLNAYKRAVDAVIAWKMFDFDWLQLCWSDAPIAAGTTVAVVVQHFGFWSINSCRIVYVVNEDNGPIRRFGFAYGTLPDHAERGEERFLVEWRQDDDSVWYDVLAFSKPNKLLAKLGYPVTRALQKRFAIDSQRAMIEAVASGK